MAARVALVLRSGGEYNLDHAYSLAQHFDPSNLLLLTDLPEIPFPYAPWETEKLRHGWPGWWSKLELMRPDIEGDLLYLDLDTRIVGDLADIRKIDHLTMLADPYRTNNPLRFGSGVMYLPESARRAAWQQFISNPGMYMQRFEYGGDQAFLIQAWGADFIARWQDLLPGQLVSYKRDVRGKGVPLNARIVYFHGQPRPWDSRVTEL